MYNIFCCGHFSIRGATFTSLDETGVSPQAKRSKQTYLAVDKENQIIGYVVPIFRGRYAPGLVRPYVVIALGETNGHLLGFRDQGYQLMRGFLGTDGIMIIVHLRIYPPVYLNVSNNPCLKKPRITRRCTFQKGFPM